MKAPRAVEVRPETPADVEAVRRLNAAAFGRPDEGRVVDELREHAALCVSLVAVQGGRVSGHIPFSSATLGEAAAPVAIAALGPMAVVPGRQCLGIGSALVRAGLDACRRVRH
jgi:putative acetyltransferase